MTPLHPAPKPTILRERDVILASQQHHYKESATQNLNGPWQRPVTYVLLHVFISNTRPRALNTPCSINKEGMYAFKCTYWRLNTHKLVRRDQAATRTFLSVQRPLVPGLASTLSGLWPAALRVGRRPSLPSRRVSLHQQ